MLYFIVGFPFNRYQIKFNGRKICAILCIDRTFAIKNSFSAPELEHLIYVCIHQFLSVWKAHSTYIHTYASTWNWFAQSSQFLVPHRIINVSSVIMTPVTKINTIFTLMKPREIQYSKWTCKLKQKINFWGTSFNASNRQLIFDLYDDIAREKESRAGEIIYTAFVKY